MKTGYISINVAENGFTVEYISGFDRVSRVFVTLNGLLDFLRISLDESAVKKNV